MRRPCEFGYNMVDLFKKNVARKAVTASLTIAKRPVSKSDWEKEAETIIPKRNYIGVYSLQGIPVEDWVEVRSDPHWWSPTTWASSSLWWCDGKRNLLEIRELCEFEADRKIDNFDLVRYYKFLEEHDLVEFVGR